MKVCLKNRLILTAIALSFANLTSLAQSIHHQNIWTRFSVSKQVNSKLKTEIELQHRTQNNYFEKNTPLDAVLLNSIRVWAYYKITKDVQLVISPFAYFWNNSIIQKPADFLKPATKEIRYSVALDVQHLLAKNFYVVNRNCLEYRNFQQTEDIIRLRNRIGFRYDFNSKFSALTFDEIFLNIKGADLSHFYDHNRLALMFTIKPNKSWRIDTGLIHINRLPKSNTSLIEEENFVLNLNYNLDNLKKNK